MQSPMKDSGHFEEMQPFRVVAETPPLARTNGGIITPRVAPSLEVERKEGSALRDIEVLDRGDDLMVNRVSRVL